MYAVDGSVPSVAGPPPITNGVNPRGAVVVGTGRSIEWANGSALQRRGGLCRRGEHARGGHGGQREREVPDAAHHSHNDSAGRFVGIGYSPAYDVAAWQGKRSYERKTPRSRRGRRLRGVRGSS